MDTILCRVERNTVLYLSLGHKLSPVQVSSLESALGVAQATWIDGGYKVRIKIADLFDPEVVEDVVFVMIREMVKEFGELVKISEKWEEVG